MTTPERLAALKGLIGEHERDRNILRPTDSRLRWLGQAVPLLNFSPTLHENAVVAADILARPGFSSSAYNQAEGRMLLLVRQGITELEHGLTPPEPENEQTVTLTDEHGLWWFLQHCTTKTRGWLITKVFVILGAVATAAYFAGRSHFISQVIDLWRKSSTP